ncbi:hypothetical protein SMSRO_SF029560 [Spiroplasma poulsonii]|uniref:Uncharacterized protein n=1 Tax=Spiroplasma poulsonii TaxID=2138 RepID=A0A2P6F8L4_9MOLU|nr:hypothetical protein SMSRO_SF029560 [Spiroplasma poulsonii]
MKEFNPKTASLRTIYRKIEDFDKINHLINHIHWMI